MEVAIMASLAAKRNMEVDPGHGCKLRGNPSDKKSGKKPQKEYRLASSI
jgi:hypothetical protein